MKLPTDRDLAQRELKRRSAPPALGFVGDEAQQVGDIVINFVIPKLHAKLAKSRDAR
jgi:hypothetical protein